MKIILRKAVENLGEQGAILNVKDGYAANYLIPAHKAYRFSEAMQKVLKEDMKQATSKASLIKKKAVELASKVRKQHFIFRIKTAKNGKIFGSVTLEQLAQSISQQMEGLQITSKQLVIKEPITEAKNYIITLKLHADVQTDVSLKVQGE